MRHSHRWIAGSLVVSAALLSACAPAVEEDESLGDAPARLEAIEGTDLSRVILTEQASQRLGMKTSGVSVQGSDTVIPYAAVFYGPEGETFTYVSPEPLTYVRESIDIDRIDGEQAILSDGPEPGADVVTQGAAELFGFETGVDE